ncbi:hypothetical protein PILCRDRAFT_817040 [Piloderma croceum F 1598]|uniref:Uncharacterized protein n=1 Tax=Piloderma croceum (strain F 1598) TaxID=765440 RepID=A0A0C3G5A3_PILCF|nr:hypothetical protein PILCRDRAFT_817040 [Piloderma croceum F 1598]
MHQLSDTMFIQPLKPKVEDMLDGRLSLSGGSQVRFRHRFKTVCLTAAFWRQPKGMLHIESCQFVGYARYGDMYKADIMLADQSEPLLVRTSWNILLSGVLMDLQIVAKAFRVLFDDHESNKQFAKVDSDICMPSTTD